MALPLWHIVNGLAGVLTMPQPKGSATCSPGDCNTPFCFTAFSDNALGSMYTQHCSWQQVPTCRL